ncbi:MAG: MopE-related protein [Saprospiraceae bacterium]
MNLLKTQLQIHGGQGLSYPYLENASITRPKNSIGKSKLLALMLAFLGIGFFSLSIQAQDYSNDFEISVTPGWDAFGAAFTPIRVASGTNGITSSGGAFHAEVTGNAATDLGGYKSVFPACGFTVSLDMYLDVSGGFANDTRVDYIAAISNTVGAHRRDFAFNIGFYNDASGPGANTNRFVISASNNAGRANAFPKNPGRAPIAISATGWYTFVHHYYDSGGGVLACDLEIYSGATLVNGWTLSDPSDIIGTTVGGNRYSWVANSEFALWAIDNSSKVENGTAPVTNINTGNTYCSIQAAINDAATLAGHTIEVGPGTYNENVLINKNNLTLRSTDGKAATTIQGTFAAGLGTVSVANGTNGVTIGEPGMGFTIIGYDGPGAIETAAVYLLGAHTDITVQYNDIRANGEHGLLSNFNAAIDNIIIDNNCFTGQTFVGAMPGGCGFSTQFNAGNNVPRQLVTIGGGAGVTNSMNITFTNNLITGVAGGFNNEAACAAIGQGNTLVTIDVIGALIENNTFAGTTARFGTSLRARGQATTVQCNTFDNAGLGLANAHIFFGTANPLTGSLTPTLADVAAKNTYPNGGAYLTPDDPTTYQIYRDLAQATAAAQAGQVAVDANNAIASVLTIGTDTKTFCWGDPSVTVGLAGTGVNVTNTLTANERVVWVLTSKPANSDYTVGDLFTVDNCGDPFKNYGELAVANSSKVIRVQSNSPVNGANDPIIGDYVFNAYIENCASGCITGEVGPFTITINFQPEAPTVGVQTKAFCYGDPGVTVGLAGTGVSVNHPDIGVGMGQDNVEHIVWELTAVPANSDYNIGDQFTTDNCGDPFKNYGELAVANYSKVIRVQSNAPVNGANQPIYGTYEFKAWAVTCNDGCPSEMLENFTITIYPTPDVDDIMDVSACDTYTLPTITGMNLSGNEAYYTGTGGTGTKYLAGDMITASTTLYIYDETATTPNCSDEESFMIDIVESITSLNIEANPAGDLCLGAMGVQYNANVVGGTGPFTFAWCAYNNGTGSGTCFNGFSDNTAQNPTRNWVASTGPKSVGVTVSQAGCPDVSDLYAFNVVADPVAPTIERDPNIDDVCVDEPLTVVVVTPGNGGAGNCVDEYRYSTDNGGTWSAWGPALPMFSAVLGTNLVESRRNCDGGGCNSNVNQVSWNVYPQPTVLCPAPITIECSDSQDPMDTGEPSGNTTLCCTNPPMITHIDDIVPGACADSYTIEREFTITYDCGISTTCNQIITVEDTTDPVITCPGDLTVECDQSIDPMDTGEATGSDNCDMDVTITPNDIIAGGNCPQNYTVVRTWTAEDNCGHTATCDQLITVQDTQGPIMTCNDLTVTPGANGEYTLTQAEIDGLTAGTTDNCGMVTFDVPQIRFTCADEGDNMITITGTDECGNSNTCVSTITVNPFLTIDGCVATDETCEGYADGTIVISATALAGQVMYSVDGGATFQLSGNFNNLSPGTYNIVVKVFGIPNVCVKTDVKTILAGPAKMVWFKDIDGDGYTDGVTITDCAQPTGFILNPLVGVDCDDYEAAINPGALEICDGLDNDCDGNLLPEEMDADNDGYMICEGDCDDNNPSVNPGATEVCDGVDNNCNGMVDEGMAEAYVGNVAFTTQAQLDAWSSCYSSIIGSVSIMGAGITDLSPLENIASITGNLSIQSTGLTNLNGLGGLNSVGGTLTIYFNSNLVSLNGLESLAFVGGAFNMYYNFQLSDCCAIYDLINGGVSGPIIIFFNKVGCNSAAEINANCAPSPLVGGNNNGQVLGHAYSQQTIAQEVAIFPNPTNGAFTVVVPENLSTGVLTLMDIHGRMLLSQKLMDGQSIYQFERGQLPSGIYLIVVKDANQTLEAKRLVIE